MAELTEAKIYEALGLDVPEGVNGQELADPAAQPNQAAQEEGAQEQESADPASSTAEPVQTGTDTQEPGAVSADEEGAGEDPGTDKQPLTPQQRRKNAARRRQQEQQTAIDQAVQAALQQERASQADAMKDFFAKAGLKNTITGAPITSMEEFKAWDQAYGDASLQQKLKDGELTPELLQKAMDNHPVIRQAQQILAQQKAAEKARQLEADKARIDGELERIGKLDPSIKTVADLLKMPTAEAFKGYVKKGCSFEEAFYLANRQRLEQQKVEAARQQALTNSRGKDHLTPVGSSRSEGAVTVPAEVMAMYRRINLKATPEEIQKHYNDFKAKGG